MFGMEKSPFGQAIKAAQDEARQRGDRRMGTEHLLLGLLRDPAGAPARALGVDAAAARAALDTLDRAALRAIGIDVGDADRARPRKHPPLSGTALTSSARAAIVQAAKATTRKNRDQAGPAQLLLALLDQRHPDPVAELIDTLAVDRAAARARLAP
ncbi:Clp protease N-terminal domain-containing protein [Nonomuraea sp. SBT364]|uniref:Clp protease N-terminal domain-containing protein n=1 Tax=Nonomuraea sp. SBT364 TaxID=1580530 RepID=UPI00066DF187|nr:Clp protease N-terminal domain-containing protein [Nonomuraea sp. SBT364]